MKELTLEQLAKIFDLWRKHYPSITYNQQCNFCNLIYDFITDENQFNYYAVSTAIKHMQQPAKVLEIGGGRGQLAKEILTSRLPIVFWNNKEICSKSIDNSVCTDNRYKANLPQDWFWKIKYTGANVAVLSHIVEHILFDQFRQFVETTGKGLAFLYIDAPIQESGTNITWRSFAGSHILEVGWKQIEELLEKFGFKKILQFASSRFFRNTAFDETKRRYL